MTQLEYILVKIAHNPQDNAWKVMVKDYPKTDVEKAITNIASIAPSWFIKNINQANIWGK